MRKSDAVGYRRPPTETRFRKGQSGNPRGRPKPIQKLENLLTQELKTTIVISEGGVQKRISKMEALVKSTTARAIKGDRGATKLLFALIGKLPASSAEEFRVTQAAEELYQQDREAAPRYREGGTAKG